MKAKIIGEIKRYKRNTPIQVVILLEVFTIQLYNLRFEQAILNSKCPPPLLASLPGICYYLNNYSINRF